MRRFLTLFVVLPIAIAVIVLSVANRESVTFSLDPIGSALSLSAPLFVFLFAALALGVILGGIGAWVRQKKWRRAARAEKAETARLRQEVERLRLHAAQSAPPLPGPHRDAA